MDDSVRPEPSRRRFLELLVASAAAPLSAACASNDGVMPSSIGDVQAGNVSALPVGTLRAITGFAVAVGRDAKGVYAMTLTCTHQGCDIGSTGSVSPTGLTCGCHGSTYDANGNVTGGPASAALQHFLVSNDAAGDLVIHTGSDVDASTRLPV
jgi:Rieske Fe-S protein